MDVEGVGEMQLASRNFVLATGPRGAKRSRPEATVMELDGAVEEDCEVESEGEDAAQRLAESAPTKRAEDLQWEECTIPVCAREKAGHGPKVAGLKQRLDDEEEPILGLFLRFFPLAYFMEHIKKLHEGEHGKTSSRHKVPWNKGTFLRFLGCIIRLAMYPLPNIEWHWRWPTVFSSDKPPGLKHLMREIVFKRYWRFAVLPAAPDGLVDYGHLVDGRS